MITKDDLLPWWLFALSINGCVFDQDVYDAEVHVIDTSYFCDRYGYCGETGSYDGVIAKEDLGIWMAKQCDIHRDGPVGNTEPVTPSCSSWSVSTLNIPLDPFQEGDLQLPLWSVHNQYNLVYPSP